MEKLRLISLILVLVIIGIFCSCVTVQDKTLQPQGRESVEIIGRVSTEFLSMQPLHYISKKAVSQKAYSKLMAEARNKYQGNIDVVNITADGSFNALTLFPIPWFCGIFANFQTIEASGDVILYSQGISQGISQNMTNAVVNASATIAERIPPASIIAVLNVYSATRNTSEYIIGEIEFNLVNSGKFKIVDRRRLDQIRIEQNFQLSGDVSDDTAISIGNMLGSNIVITGEISGSGSNMRLILKALDVRTAQIITMARESL